MPSVIIQIGGTNMHKDPTPETRSSESALIVCFRSASAGGSAGVVGRHGIVGADLACGVTKSQ